MTSRRNFRIIPLVLAAIIGLVTLKTLGLVLEGGYIFDDRNVPSATTSNPVSDRMSWAQEMFNFPGGRSSAKSRPAPDASDITGSVAAKKEEPKPEKKAEDKPAEPPAGQVVVLPQEGERAVSASERAILERLQERRQELEARAREIDIRENLLKAAEKRIEGKVEEMKAVEARMGAANDQKTEANAAKFKGIVTMYEAMKPKDAAKIFDRLEMSVLIEVASQIAPRKMSDIVGQMQPEAAERLTVEMARRAGGDKTASAADLPKIEGRPVDGSSN